MTGRLGMYEEYMESFLKCGDSSYVSDEDRNDGKEDEDINAVKRHLISAAIKAAAAAAAFFMTFTFIFGVKTVETNDMFPQIQAGDVAVYFRLAGITRQDAVIYQTTRGTAAGRIAAASGDTVDITESGQIVINGNIQPIQKRTGIFQETYKKGSRVQYPVKPAENEYFILGDDREGADDSRVYGCIRKENIRGSIFILIRRRAV